MFIKFNASDRNDSIIDCKVEDEVKSDSNLFLPGCQMRLLQDSVARWGRGRRGAGERRGGEEKIESKFDRKSKRRHRHKQHPVVLSVEGQQVSMLQTFVKSFYKGLGRIFGALIFLNTSFTTNYCTDLNSYQNMLIVKLRYAMCIFIQFFCKHVR